MRMASPERVEPSFVHDMLEATKFQGDETYFARLAAEAPATVAWIKSHGVEFHQPTYYLAKGPPRIQPVGGGPAIIETLSRAAKAGRRHDPLFVAGAKLHPPRRAHPRRRDCGRGRGAKNPGRCGDPRRRRLPGQSRDDARALRPRRRRHSSDLARHALQHRRRHPHGARRGRRQVRRLERHAHRADRPAQPELRAGRAGLSLRHRGGQNRPPFLRRGRRPGARDLGDVFALAAFRGAGPRGLRHPRQAALRHPGLAARGSLRGAADRSADAAPSLRPRSASMRGC